MKKGQGISINTIIIAAIALIVLIILIGIFSGRMTIFGVGLDDANRGDTCPNNNWKVQCDEGENPLYTNLVDAEDNPGKTCCVAS